MGDLMGLKQLNTPKTWACSGVVPVIVLNDGGCWAVTDALRRSLTFTGDGLLRSFGDKRIPFILFF